MTFWVFDIFHKWHEVFIKTLLRKTDKLYIVLMEDKKVKEKKGKRVIFNSKLRKIIIQNKLQNFVKEHKLIVLEGKENPYLDLLDIKPEIVFIGYDQDFEDKLEKAGFKYEKAKLEEGFDILKNKSSIIRNSLKRKEI